MNELTIQRLADGELDANQRAAAIRQLDRCPDQWRKVALELLHRRLLDRAIGHHVDEQLSACTIGGSDELKSRQSGIARRRLLNPLAMAATVLLMLSLGYWLGQTDLRRATVVEHPAILDQLSAESRLSLADALAKCVTPVPDSFRREMLSAGYFVAEDQQLRQVELPTGRTIEMPVRHFNIHYLGNSAFQ